MIADDINKPQTTYKRPSAGHDCDFDTFWDEATASEQIDFLRAHLCDMPGRCVCAIVHNFDNEQAVEDYLKSNVRYKNIMGLLVYLESFDGEILSDFVDFWLEYSPEGREHTGVVDAFGYSLLWLEDGLSLDSENHPYLTVAYDREGTLCVSTESLPWPVEDLKWQVFRDVQLGVSRWVHSLDSVMGWWLFGTEK